MHRPSCLDWCFICIILKAPIHQILKPVYTQHRYNITLSLHSLCYIIVTKVNQRPDGEYWQPLPDVNLCTWLMSLCQETRDQHQPLRSLGSRDYLCPQFNQVGQLTQFLWRQINKNHGPTSDNTTHPHLIFCYYLQPGFTWLPDRSLLLLQLQPFYGSLDNPSEPVPEGTFRHLVDLTDHTYRNWFAYTDNVEQQKWMITSRANESWITECTYTVPLHLQMTALPMLTCWWPCTLFLGTACHWPVTIQSREDWY